MLLYSDMGTLNAKTKEQVNIPFKLPVRLEVTSSSFLLIADDAELIAEMFSVTMNEANTIVYLINKGEEK